MADASAKKPEDFVIATGNQYSVRQFIIWAAEELGISLKFSGKGDKEVAVVASVSGDKAPEIKVGDIILKLTL